MSEWKELKIANAPFEIIDGDRGTNYPKQDEFYQSGYCLFLNAKNVTTDGFTFNECYFITKEKDQILRKGKLQRDDIVLTTRGTVGNIGFYDARIPYENIRINSGMVIIRPDPDCISPEYNHQLFKYLKSDFDVFATGSAQPQLPIRDLKEISFFLPPLPKQHAIAGVLSSLDDKIDLLHRQNKTLEGIADALWRQMFVEEAKEDWKEIKLDSVIGIMSGYNHSINEIRDFGDYLLSMGSIIKTYGIDLNATRFINSENISSQYLCKTGDIIITTRDITQDAELLGSPGIIPKYLNTKNIYAGSNLYKLEIKENKLNKNLLYWLLRSELYRSFVKEIASGTSVLMLKKSDLMNFTFKLPPNNILKRCENEISDVQEKLENNFTQIRTLVLLREALLPKLMSGEVRVKI